MRRNHDAAGFGLPPGIDDGAAAVANDAVVPKPGFRVDRLTDRAEQTQRGARGVFEPARRPHASTRARAVGAV